MAKKVVLIGGRAGSGKDTAGTHLVESHAAVLIGQADPMKRFLREFLQFSEEQLWGPSDLRNMRDPSYDNIQPEHMEDVLDGLEYQFETCAPTFVHSVLPDLNRDERKDAYCQLRDYWLPPILDKIGSFQGITPRFSLQTLGTDWGRKMVNEDMWVEYALRISDLLFWGGFDYKRETGLVAASKAQVDLVAMTDGRFLNEFRAVKNAGGLTMKLERLSSTPTLVTGGVAGHLSEEEIDAIDPDYFDCLIRNEGSLQDLFAAVDRGISGR